jgi:hypothetical protein
MAPDRYAAGLLRVGGEADVVCHDKKTGEYIFMIVHRKVRIQRVVNRAATTCGSRRLRSILAQ